MASPDDPESHAPLLEASTQVNDAVQNLLHLCDTTNPGQRELSSALETVRNALDRLNADAAPSKQRSIDELNQAAGNVDKAADGVSRVCTSGG